MDDDGKRAMVRADMEMDIAQMQANVARARRDLIHMEHQKAEKEQAVEQWQEKIKAKQAELKQLTRGE